MNSLFHWVIMQLKLYLLKIKKSITLKQSFKNTFVQEDTNTNEVISVIRNLLSKKS